MERQVDIHILGSHVGGDSKTFLSATLFRSVDGNHTSKLNFTLLEGVGGQRSQLFGIHCLSVATHQSGASIAFGNMAHEDQTGFRAGLINECDGHQSGFTAGLHSQVRSQSGWVFNAFNLVETEAKGAIFSLYTRIGEALQGFAAGLCVNVNRFKGTILSLVTLVKDVESSAGLILGLVIIRLDKEKRGDRLRFLFMRCVPDAKEQKPSEQSQQSIQQPTPRTA